MPASLRDTTAGRVTDVVPRADRAATGGGPDPYSSRARVAPTISAPADGCAVVSHLLGEVMAGTATPIRSWLLVEYSAAWSRTAREDVLAAVLPRRGRELLRELTRDAGLRPLLIRRNGRGTSAGAPAVVVGSSTAGRTWLERIPVRSLRDLATLDLSAVAAGERGLGEPVDGPLLLVCTHGAKDMCCAVSGRPLAAALTAAYGDRVWECTHLGGDRFAGNVAVLPHGYLYGRVSPAAALDLAAQVVDGQVALDNLRGRSCWSPAGQWAEAEVRRTGGFRGLEDVEVLAVEEQDGASRVVLRAPDGPWRVHVARRVLGTSGASRCAVELRPSGFVTLATTRP